MNENIKTVIIVSCCILAIFASAILFDSVRAENSRQVIELEGLSFKAPVGFEYVNNSFNITQNETSNQTISSLKIRQNDKIIAIEQLDSSFENQSNDFITVNDVRIYKIFNNEMIYAFDYNGVRYQIIMMEENDSLVKDIVSTFGEIK
ncbi:hypothetical protein MBCUT_19660 [Methanobrevibacter cuticularis]|uniref:DUF4367 domain-containing protein n=1 Tax=Methanobrevibacter cuticularis TaxID=47311 RepID=A0A166CPB9_9EURY|nr:hypothetical protein [Methanobrevibacter cuticularis]KZX14724.1 hypothetical protein MBCUT_19660 [Methanobrevibacter cuticularis]